MVACTTKQAPASKVWQAQLHFLFIFKLKIVHDPKKLMLCASSIIFTAREGRRSAAINYYYIYILNNDYSQEWRQNKSAHIYTL